jgi:hypothetical protein
MEDFEERRPLARETDAKVVNVVPTQDKLPAYQSKHTRNKNTMMKTRIKF